MLEDDETGARTWGCAKLLCACVAGAERDGALALLPAEGAALLGELGGKAVLELGAGTGELTRALARAGAARAIATDLPHRVSEVSERWRRTRRRTRAMHDE